MASIKNQIATYAAGSNVLGFATGKPSGLAIRRGNLIPSTGAREPEISVYVGPETQWTPVGLRSRGNPVHRVFRLLLEIRASGTVTDVSDDVLDPLEVWAETRLFADETMGGLAGGIVGFGVERAGFQADKGYYLSTVYADLEFTTKRGVPDSRGDA